MKPGEPIGEVWLTGDESRFQNGPPSGMTLAQAVRQFGSELCGSAWPDVRFPILAKYLFTSDWLSVQVHPDDDYARVHDRGGTGKCEMWYIVRAGRGAEILLGTGRGATLDKLRSAFEKGKSREVLARHRPRAGQAYYVAPGTVHALGPALVLFEAEQNSDLTYRLDDYGRKGLDGKPRALHLKKGMDVLRVDASPRVALPRHEVKEDYGTRRFVVACRYFAVEEIMTRRSAAFQSSPRRVELLSVVEGEGRVETSAGWMSFNTGDTWLIPPATGAYRLVPEERARFLKSYVPDLEKDFRQPLARHRVGAREIARLVHE